MDGVAFGCSHTYGVGVEKNKNWPCLLGVKNFGLAGCSADYVTRIAPNLILNNNANVVFVLWPDWTRFEHTVNGKIVTSLPTDTNRIHYMKSHPTEVLMANFYNQVTVLRNWCDTQNIKLVDMTLYDLIPYIDHADTWPLSKLGHHYAPEWHTWVAAIFDNSYKHNIRHSLRYE